MEGIDTIAINLSGQSIGDRDFHRDLMRMIRGASFDVRKLCLEITETAAITRLADAKSFIDEVRSFGIRIALDDFGAGASSFGYLRMLPVDYLKIDGQFITGLLEDPLDNAAVRCFCEVARVIGVRTIAEFVEAPEVREALRVIGVDFAQGYLIHRAEPFPDLLPRVVRPDLMAAKG
jgi:EAL domain-containing protein (putative c-di-GMP-specific phosphodiesterase class I)